MAQHLADGSEIPCKGGHRWDGVMPSVDKYVLQVQNHSLIGQVCDCNRFRYSESQKSCGCGGSPKWEINLEPNES